MKIDLLILIAIGICSACNKNGGDSSSAKDSDVNDFEVVRYAPVPLTKEVDKKVYVHLMPWFEDKTTNDVPGKWGQHWTMNTKNPDILTATGKRDIAAHFYPLTGPYASGDADIIEYQLLLMKLSGIDGVLIDWPGITRLYDYPLLVRNTEKIIDKIKDVGLKFAVVYEDQNINIAFNNKVISDKITAAKKDMAYVSANYFSKDSYIKEGDAPLLLVFGPQTFETEAEWTQIFSGLNPKPSFYTLWNESHEAGSHARGEFAWVYKNHVHDLQAFYNKTYNGTKMASAYPGFQAFYTEGGWGTNPFHITTSLETFLTTLDLALQHAAPSLQLVTWNDYGEGTMLEPTQEFGFSFLTSLQQKLKVKAIQEKDLQMVLQLYQYRQKRKTLPAIQKKLDQVFYYLVALKLEEAEKLLSTIE